MRSSKLSEFEDSLSSYKLSPVDWGCGIQWLNLYRGKWPHLNECPDYDIKSSDGMALTLEIWGMWSTSSLPLLPGPLWLRVVAPDRVLSMCQIEQTVCKQMTDIKFWLLNCNTWNYLTAYKQRAQACLTMLSTKCVYKSYIYIFNIYV